jgi:hypothetical protein
MEVLKRQINIRILHNNTTYVSALLLIVSDMSGKLGVSQDRVCLQLHYTLRKGKYSIMIIYTNVKFHREMSKRVIYVFSCIYNLFIIRLVHVIKVYLLSFFVSFIIYSALLYLLLVDVQGYRGADKSLAQPTFRCILFDGENISFEASLVLYIYMYI